MHGRKNIKLNSHLPEDEKISTLRNIALILGSLMIRIKIFFSLLSEKLKKTIQIKKVPELAVFPGPVN